MSKGWVRYWRRNFNLEVEWSVDEGEVLALTGPSGAGKTTTLRAIAGTLHPQEGHIRIGPDDVVDSQRGFWAPPHHRKVGYMPQGFSLFPHLSAEENIAFGLWKWPKEERRQRTAELATLFGLDELKKRHPLQLSAGQQQRVALARALGPRPGVLLLDEPFSYLDAELRRRLRDELRYYAAEWGVPIILVTHDYAEIRALADRIIFIENGKIGDPSAIIGENKNLYEAKRLDVDPVGPFELCEVQSVRLVVPMSHLWRHATLRLVVSPEDILISIESPDGLSAENILPGIIRNVESGQGWALVAMDCGFPLTARLRQIEADRLGLIPGSRVWAVIRANSWSVMPSQHGPSSTTD